MKKRVRTNGFIILAAVVLIVIFPDKFLRPVSGRIDGLLSLLGMALMLCGLLLRVSSRGSKSELSSGGLSLVEGGPYVLVRNPMYLGIFLIGCGVILICFQWWLLLVFLAVLAMRYATLIVKEEKLLLDKFGDKYRDYLRRVPRLFPRIKDLIGKTASKYLPIKLKWLKKEAVSIVALVVVTMFLKLRAGFHDRQDIIFVPQYIGLIIMVVFFAALTIFLSKKNENST